MKSDEAIFRAMCTQGKFLYLHPDDMYTYAMENAGTEVTVHVVPAVKTSEKQKMYNYWYGPLLNCAVKGFTEAGYEGVDKEAADYLLKSLFAKDFVKRPDGQFEPVIKGKAKMNKARLLKLIQDALHFLESQLNQSVPDAEEYKMMQLTGRSIKRIRNDKENQ